VLRVAVGGGEEGVRAVDAGEDGDEPGGQAQQPGQADHPPRTPHRRLRLRTINIYIKNHPLLKIGLARCRSWGTTSTCYTVLWNNVLKILEKYRIYALFSEIF